MMPNQRLAGAMAGLGARPTLQHFGMDDTENGMLNDQRTANTNAVTEQIQNHQFDPNPGAYHAGPEWDILSNALKGQKVNLKQMTSRMPTAMGA